MDDPLVCICLAGNIRQLMPTICTMECFGSESEEESNEPTQRDESCGICSFHAHTESSLLSHVRNSLKSAELESLVQRAEHVLNSIDEFCMMRHWMMNIGPEKGTIISTTLKETIDVKLSGQASKQPFVLVELGSYCGYSSILVAKECIAAYGNKLDLKLITLEINPEYITVANEMIKLSGLDGVISLLEVSFNGHDTNLVDTLQKELTLSQLDTIDVLFIDHDKDSYRSDLMKLEASGLIRCGARVIADNVIFAKIDDYLRFVQKRQQDGVVATKTVKCNVEYSNVDSTVEYAETLADGIGE